MTTQTDLTPRSESEKQDDALIGQVLADQYRIDARLGGGGMGAVYRGVQLSVNRPVAVKLISAHVEKHAEHVRRFQREGEALAKLHHPNTVRLFDFGLTPAGQMFMVMELLDGRNLGELLEEHGALPPAQALGIARQVAQSLSEAHAVGVVHRDLKPANVFLSRVEGGDSFVKVMDFGIAGFEQDLQRTRLTMRGALIGTPAYMAPEQAEGEAVDARADLYSLGIILFEVITGRPPFAADTAVSLLLAHVSEPPPRLADVCPSLPAIERVQALLDRLLAKTPAARPASTNEVIASIDAILLELLPEACASEADMGALSGPAPLVHAEGMLATAAMPTPMTWTLAAASGRWRWRRRPRRSWALPALALAGASLALLLGPAMHGTQYTAELASRTATTARALYRDGRDRLSRALASAAPASAQPGDAEASAHAELARVTIASTPSGASVRLAGAELGKTPYELRLKHPTKVEVVLRGHPKRTLVVDPGGEPNLIVHFRPRDRATAANGKPAP